VQAGRIQTALTIFLDGIGSIQHVVNDHGAPTTKDVPARADGALG
jgi:hypothetical protein